MAEQESIIRDLIAKIADEHDFKNYELVIKPISSGGANFSSALFLITVKCPGKEDVELFAKIANNITAEGFKLHNRREPVSWEYAESAIKNLAKFHALSFAYQKENPKEFEELCNGQTLSKYVEADNMKDMWDMQRKATLKIIRNYGYKLRAAKLLKNLGDEAMFKFQRHLGTKVIIHGDFRPDNMMYREKDNKIEVMTLDYQTMRVGSPASDLMFFEACATDGAFRAKYHERLMNLYYAELSAAMQRLGVDPKKAYSRETFDSELKQSLPFFLFLSMAVLRVMLVDVDKAPKVDSEDAGMENFMELPTTRAFIDRFNEAVEDCARWGVI
ncbi:ecdysteroid kinase domain-containing protein [Phthorimaea operculella]|nr:ecdysteroid kinase domain-containing protein [Phthorimaea operculella]